MIKKRPILFSAPMVRALLDGSKTQTRRVANVANTMGIECILGRRRPDGYARTYLLNRDIDVIEAGEACPYGQPGDQLWVKETHWHDDEDGSILYAANRNDFEIVQQNKHETGSQRYNWKPSIFMLQSASRITLEITGVRIERLQDISELDALAEGVHAGSWEYNNGEGTETAKESYECLWDHINGPESWNANPWVWVVEFKVMKP